MYRIWQLPRISSLHDQRVKRSPSRVLAALHPSGAHPAPEVLVSKSFAITATEVLSPASISLPPLSSGPTNDVGDGVAINADDPVSGEVCGESGEDVGVVVDDAIGGSPRGGIGVEMGDSTGGVVGNAMGGEDGGAMGGDVGGKVGGVTDDIVGGAVGDRFD